MGSKRKSVARARDRQITFYADPDVYEWLKSQDSVTRYINSTVRANMPAATGTTDSTTPATRDASAASMVDELEQIQGAILRTNRCQQAMIGALKAHQMLFEKSATMYGDFTRVQEEDSRPETEEVVKSYRELLVNSAETIKEIIQSHEGEEKSLITPEGLRDRLISAVESKAGPDLAAPARSFPLNVNE